MKKRNDRFKNLFYAFLIAIGIISLWRGIWGLWDVYVFPNDYTLSLCISVVVGILILISTHHFVKRFLE